MPATHDSGDPDTGRRRRRKAAGLAMAGATTALLLWLCCYTVYTGEYALVTEFGKPVQVVTAPGLRFKFPYQSVRTLDARLFAYTPASTEFLTLEKTPVVAASTVLWRISDPKKFFQTVFDRAGAESRLGDILFSELGAAIGRNPLPAFVSMEPGAYRAEAILSQVAAHCREIALRNYGIDVVDVQLRTLRFPEAEPPAGLLADEVRARAHQHEVPLRRRRRGPQDPRRGGAGEDAASSPTALKLAQQQRGEGEGKAAQIYSQALSQGPEFYRFVRSMEAVAQPPAQRHDAGAAGELGAVRPAQGQRLLRAQRWDEESHERSEPQKGVSHGLETCNRET